MQKYFHSHWIRLIKLLPLVYFLQKCVLTWALTAGRLCPLVWPASGWPGSTTPSHRRASAARRQAASTSPSRCSGWECLKKKTTTKKTCSVTKPSIIANYWAFLSYFRLYLGVTVPERIQRLWAFSSSTALLICAFGFLMMCPSSRTTLSQLIPCKGLLFWKETYNVCY